MRISLRKFLAVVARAGAGLELPLGMLSIPAGRMAASASVRSPVIEPFVVPLPIPPVLEPKRTNSGVDYHEITGRVRKQEILLGLRGYARPILPSARQMCPLRMR